MKSIPGWLAIAIGLTLAACSQQQKLDEPPKIQLGIDACNECYMLINEEKYASAYVTTDGQIRVFDDIGCMLKHLEKTGETPLHMWVHHFLDARWLESDSAVFLKSPALETPMGYGIIAVGKPEQADSLKGVLQGDIMPFAELQKSLSGVKP